MPRSVRLHAWSPTERAKAFDRVASVTGFRAAERCVSVTAPSAWGAVCCRSVSFCTEGASPMTANRTPQSARRAARTAAIGAVALTAAVALPAFAIDRGGDGAVDAV